MKRPTRTTGSDDELGRRTNRVDTGTVVNAFGYNMRSELVTAAMGTNWDSYVYDSIGNRSVWWDGTGMTYYSPNQLNQLRYMQIYPSLWDPWIDYEHIYDADGNLTTTTSAYPSASGSIAYRWDAENRLIAVEPLSPTNGASMVQFAYDHQGRRVRKVASTWSGTEWLPVATNAFLYDGWNLILELQSTASSLQTNTYTWGLDLSGTLQGAGGIGGLLCAVAGGAGSPSAPYFPCSDANGNITDYVDTNGNVVAHREYDPYGNTILATGSKEALFNVWFSSKYWDRETSLGYWGYRYYSAMQGRWLSRDQAQEEGGANLYGFAKNAALNYIDPRGDAPTSGGVVARPARCGQADVTRSVQAILKDIEDNYKDWGPCEKLSHCMAIYGKHLNHAWDILDLGGVGLGYRWPPRWNDLGAREGSGGSDSVCERTVIYGGSCCHASAVNYLMWGRINRLCHDTFSRLPPLSLRPVGGAVWSLPWAVSAMEVWKYMSVANGKYPADAVSLIPESAVFTAYGYSGFRGPSMPYHTSSCSMEGRRDIPLGAFSGNPPWKWDKIW